MSSPWVFDLEHAREITRIRLEYLDSLLRSLKGLEIKTVLDAGCGVGYFSEHFSKQGFTVTGLDAKPENIVEAGRRRPGIRFETGNIEEKAIRDLGAFDLVLAFGLLYHLENPFAAIRNLHALTGKLLIAETVITPHKYPYAAIINEFQSPDQSLNAVALIPSEPAFVAMFNKAGFQTYQPKRLPDHEDFRELGSRRRMRTVLIGSKLSSPLPADFFLHKPDPPQRELWRKSIGYYIAYLKTRLKARLKKFIQDYRGKFPLPIPIRLPFGAWWLAWNDGIGRFLLLREKFEIGERNFLFDFISPGMTFIDIGAHQGFYTLFASKKTGPSGKVIAFEPSKREYGRLIFHAAINRCKNVRLENQALGAEEGTAEFFVCMGLETGCNSLRPPNVPDRIKKIDVRMTTLDAYIQRANLSRIDFIKIDAEGGERDLLKGGIETLKKFRPVILCELDDKRSKPWGYSAGEVYDWFSSLKYERFFLTAEGKLKASVRKERFEENLIAVPEEKVAALSRFITFKREAFSGVSEF